MYIAQAFHERSLEVILGDIRRWPFATLVTPSSELGTQISHLPLIIKGESPDSLVIEGHIARANDHWRAFNETTSSVAIFHGPHAYISPRWYATNVAVPTWNYVVVHAHGIITIVEDSSELRSHLEQMVKLFESGSEAWAVDQMPSGLYEKLSGAIVFFRMPVRLLEEKSKLGQNRSAADIAGAIHGLRGIGNPASTDLAALTELRISR